MRIISWNVNGLRAAYKKGFGDWLKKSKADIICLQEVRAREKDLPAALIKPNNYHVYFSPALKPGYSGVAVYSKQKPLSVETKIGIKRFDEEGRMLRLRYPKFDLLNLYIPHGGRGKENMKYKLGVYSSLLKYLKQIGQKNIILAGDFNVAHQEIDLARPKQNKNNTMFTPEERQEIDKIIDSRFIDSFRKFYQEGKNYTWWPYFVQARKRNLGWRIDYIFISSFLAPQLKDAFILSEVMGSDHCPIGIEILFN